MITNEKIEILEVSVLSKAVTIKYKIKEPAISGTGDLPKDTLITVQYEVIDNQLISTYENIKVV